MVILMSVLENFFELQWMHINTIHFLKGQIYSVLVLAVLKLEFCPMMMVVVNHLREVNGLLIQAVASQKCHSVNMI